MILDKVLILKGLGGLTVLGGSAAAVCFVVFNNDSDAKKLKKDLGLPSDCNLPSSGSTTCKLDADKLKKIKFDGKTDTTSSITVTGTVTLKIDKTSDTNTYPKGYKFTFENTNDLSIPKTSSSDVISIKKGTNTEFKIKETTPSDGGAKTLSLEKAWTVTTLAQKVGLTCTVSGSTKQCDLPTNKKINVAFSSDDKSKEATIQESDSSKKLTFAEDAADHNQGFKFTTSADISLSESSDKKIEASSGTNSPSYEIKEIGGTWYLAKKETTNGVSG